MTCRADSLELMLAGISPRFSIEKPLDTIQQSGPDMVSQSPAAAAGPALSGNSGRFNIVACGTDRPQATAAPAAAAADMPRSGTICPGRQRVLLFR